jgi:hypothetical protein
MVSVSKFWHVEIVIYLFENEESIKELVDVLFSLVLQVAKKDDNLYLPTRYCFIFKILISCFSFLFILFAKFWILFFCFLFMLFINKVNQVLRFLLFGKKLYG